MRMISCYWIFPLLLTYSLSVFAQKEKPPESISLALRPPVFRDLGDAVALLKNRAVRIELGVSHEVLKKLEDIETKQSSARLEVQGLLGTGNPSDAVLFKSTVAAVKKEAIAAYASLLTKSQLDRLWQITNHVEIAYLGLPRAMTEGQLGTQVGVYENQKEHLNIRGREIFLTLDKDVELLHKNLHVAVMQLLTENQQLKWKQVFGTFFYCNDAGTVGRKLENQNRIEINDQRKDVFDDFDSGYSMFLFLKQPRIRDELEMNDAQLRAYMSFHTKILQAGILENNSLEAAKIIEEILVPSQVERLKQITFHLEVASKDYSAVLNGRIGRELEINGEQKTSLLKHIIDLEQNVSRDTKLLMKNLQSLFLKELSREQRDRAKQLLGESFYYMDAILAYRNEQR